MAKGMTTSEIRSQFKAVKEQISSEALGKLIAAQARALAQEVEDGHRRQVGTTFPRTQIVDGIMGGRLEAGRRVIVFRWSVSGYVVKWIIDELRRRSPVLTGKYRDSHRIYVNGQRMDGAFSTGSRPIRPGDEVIIASTVPYARKIEGYRAFAGFSSRFDGPTGKRVGGQSRQAPRGVYEVTAMAAKRRFGGEDNAAALIRFTYAELEPDEPLNFARKYDGKSRKPNRRLSDRRRFPAIRITAAP